MVQKARSALDCLDKPSSSHTTLLTANSPNSFAIGSKRVLLHFSEGKVLAGVTVAVLLGLCLGKVLGIYLFSWIAIRIKLASLSPSVKWGHMLGVAMLGGVGFTVALFLAGLSYPTGSDMLNHAKLGVVFGSFLSGIVGFAILKLTLKK